MALIFRKGLTMFGAVLALVLIAAYVVASGYFAASPKSRVSDATLAHDCEHSVWANGM